MRIDRHRYLVLICKIKIALFRLGLHALHRSHQGLSLAAGVPVRMTWRSCDQSRILVGSPRWVGADVRQGIDGGPLPPKRPTDNSQFEFSSCNSPTPSMINTAANRHHGPAALSFGICGGLSSSLQCLAHVFFPSSFP